MDYKNLVADRQLILSRHFTAGRSAKIDRVIIHHNAGNLTAEQIYQVWQTREASAHYQVDAKGVVSQHVWDANTAWHCAGQNSRSIGIEHANSGGAGAGWPINAVTRTVGARLVAAICRYYGLGRPQYGVNVFAHRDFNATECPAKLKTEYLGEYMREAQAFYDSGLSDTNTNTNTNTNTAAQQQQKELIDDMKATHIIFEHGGNLYLASLLSMTYQRIPNPRTLEDMVAVLARTGAKCVNWSHFSGSKTNRVDNPAAFGKEVK